MLLKALRSVLLWHQHNAGFRYLVGKLPILVLILTISDLALLPFKECLSKKHLLRFTCFLHGHFLGMFTLNSYQFDGLI